MVARPTLFLSFPCTLAGNFFFRLVARDTARDSEGFAMAEKQRTRPNVLITGTPGVGKSTCAEQVAAALAGIAFFRGKLPSFEKMEK